MRLKTLLIGLLFLPCTAYLQILTGPPTYVMETTMEMPSGKVFFENYFLDKTMRLDFYHTGNAMEDHFATDQVVSDGLWSGSKSLLTDRLELGQYFFEVLDAESKTLIYSRGFSSIFGEWQTTPDADKGSATFHESLRFPWPRKPVLVSNTSKKNFLHVLVPLRADQNRFFGHGNRIDSYRKFHYFYLLPV